MVEILKQDQYRPLPVEKQVAIIFAGVNGLIDDVPVTAINKFETEFFKFLEQKHADILSEIREKKTIDDALKGRFSVVVADFKKGFAA